MRVGVRVRALLVAICDAAAASTRAPSSMSVSGPKSETTVSGLAPPRLRSSMLTSKSSNHALVPLSTACGGTAAVSMRTRAPA